MLDLRGAIVRTGGPGFALVEKQGFVHPEYLRLLPGVGPWDYGRTTRVPDNLLPLRTQRREPLEVPPCPTSGMILRQYQVEAVRFAESAGWCCVIGHDVGLGKTATALMIHTLSARKSGGADHPLLIVGPLISAGAWVGPDADPAVHFGLRIAHLRTRTPQKYIDANLDELREADGYFINYEVLAAWQLQLSGYGIRTVIVDEAHLLRGGKTAAAQAFRALVRAADVRTRLALTATPVVNKVADLWSQLDFVQPDGFGHWTDYVIRYCGAHPTVYTKYALGDETNADELRQRLSRVLTRRSRFEVRRELPTFERQLVALAPRDLDRGLVRRYRDLEEDYRLNGDPTDPRGLSLQQMTAMSSVLAEAKRPFAAQEAETLAYAQGAVVVFTWFKETAAHVAEELRLAGVETFGPIDSTTTKAKRDQAAETFKQTVQARRERTRRAPVAFVATIGTAGMSMNQLAVSPCALCCELYWVPAILLQMEGRIHREGQIAAACFVRYLYVRGTMDELMLQHLQAKARAIERVANDHEALSLCEALGGAPDGKDLAALCAALMLHRDEGDGEAK